MLGARGHSGQRGHAMVEMSAHAHAAHVHHPSPAPPLAPTPAAAPAAHPSAPPAVETPEPAAVPAVVLRPALRRRLTCTVVPANAWRDDPPWAPPTPSSPTGSPCASAASQRVIRVGDKAETLVRVGHVHVQHLPKLGKVLPDRLHGHRRLEPADEHLGGVRQVGEPRWGISSLRPSTTCSSSSTAAMALLSAKLTKPKPRDLPSGPVLTVHVVTSPKRSKYSRRAWSVVSHARLLTHVRTDVIVAGPWRRRRRGAR